MTVKILAVAAASIFLWVLFHTNRTKSVDAPLPNWDSTSPESHLLWVKKRAAVVDDEKTLNIHVIPHTHDDVGWRKTVDQYYYGWNNSIDDRGDVQGIIGNSIQALLDSPTRTFTYVEMKFFSMWWHNQTNAVQDKVRFLIANRQLVFVNGGWCMHDEAAAHYMGMLDQTTLGHEFLIHEVGGVVPRVGWQLDPFGHSATQASLLSREFDALYFGRIDYQDRSLRLLTRQCEGFWNASQNDDTTLFWGLTGQYGGNYGCPQGFCFDRLCVEDEPLVGLNETRLRHRLHDFLEQMRIEADQTQGNHIMVTMGGDFTFEKAEMFYSNIDILIGSVMSYQHWNIFDIPAMFGPRYEKVNIFYSDPEYYTDMKYGETVRANSKGQGKSGVSQNEETEPNWQVKTDDFFPYSDCGHCFWTGYFTSRTSFKRFERVCSSFLLAARQIHTLWSSGSDGHSRKPCSFSKGCNCPIASLEDALGIAQHHDAISGTAKQHVADDYSLRLQTGLDLAASHVADILKKQLDNATDSVLANLQYCGQLNETICQISEAATKVKGTDVYVVVYNALGSEQSTIVRLPVSSEATYKVQRIASNASSLISTKPRTIWASPTSFDEESKLVAIFDTGPLPPLGATVFRVQMISPVESAPRGFERLEESAVSERRMSARANSQEIVHSTDKVTASFDKTTGALTKVSSNGVDIDVSQTWGYYTSFDRDIDYTSIPNDQDSGAYIFRPSVPEQSLIEVDPASEGVQFLNTSVGVEVHMKFKEPWIRQVTRVFSSQPYLEIEYTVGPLPIDDGRGREVVTRFIAPSIKNGATFYTDSNGREFLERQRNFRPTWDLEVYEPIAGNYYPVNAGIYIEDEDAALTVLTDRSAGGASILDGSVELMVQRRTLKDDYRGVDEPMNETTGGVTPYPPYGAAARVGEGVVIRGKYRLYVGKSGAKLARTGMDAAFAEPIIFVSSAAPNSTVSNPTITGLNETTPRNVMIMTLKPVLPLPPATKSKPRPDERNFGDDKETWMIRLGHQYSKGEDAKMGSLPATVNITSMFREWKVLEVIETSLTGNRKLANATRLHWNLKSHPTVPRRMANTIRQDGVVILQPMDVRTFHVTIGHK